jgi:hypothetical protein
VDAVVAVVLSVKSVLIPVIGEVGAVPSELTLADVVVVTANSVLIPVSREVASLVAGDGGISVDFEKLLDGSVAYVFLIAGNFLSVVSVVSINILVDRLDVEAIIGLD